MRGILRAPLLLLVFLQRLVGAGADNVFSRQCQLILVSDGTKQNAIQAASSTNISDPFASQTDEWLVTKNRIAATQMAIHHLEQRDASVVPAIAEMRCHVNFSLSVVLSETHVDVIQGIVQKLLPSDNVCPANGSNTSTSSSWDDFNPCVAMVGPFQRRTIADTRAFSQSLNFSQVTVGAVLQQLEQFPQETLWRNNFVLSSHLVQTAVDYWMEGDDPRLFISVIYDVIGVDALLQTEDTVDPRLQLEVFPMGTATLTDKKEMLEVIHGTLYKVKQLGHHTIMAALEDVSQTLPLIAEVAMELDLVGDDFLWTVLTGLDQEAFPQQQDVDAALHFLSTQSGSAGYQLVKGSAFLRPLDQFQYQSPDAFLQSWRQQDSTTLLSNAKEVEFEDTFFQGPRQGPVVSTSFIYDAVLSLGFNLCHQDQLEVDSFDGASGRVEYDAASDYSRNFSSVVYGLYNVQETEDGLRVKLVSIRDSSGWRAFNNSGGFVFHDGTTNPPKPLRDPGDGSHIQRRVRIMGLLAMAVALTWSVLAAIWVWIFWTHPVVKAGQPEFLLLLCLGAFVLSTAIYPASLDERTGFGIRQLDKACMSIPWLFSLGSIIIDSALFCKLWRINKLFQFKRQSVTVWGVLGPFAVFLLSSVLILTAWTIKSPLYWTREEVAQVPYTTVGGCDGDSTAAFAAPLLSLTMALTIMTAAMAWKTRDIPGEYSQSQGIFNALLAMSQLWAVGLPVYIILGTKDTDIYFIGFTGIVFLYAMSAVTLVIGPKMVTVWTESRGGGSGRTNSRVKTSRQEGGTGGASTGLVGQGGVIISGLSEPGKVETIGNDGDGPRI